MKKPGLIIAAVIAFVAGILLFSAMFTVQQTQQALILQFGKPVHQIKVPGLHFKLPLVQNVEYYDRRILDLDPPVQEVILADQKRINLDAFARYKIVDALKFRQRAQTDANFREVFGNRLNAAVRAEIGRILLGDMLTEKRADVMELITKQMESQAPEFGVEVVDVRIGRTDLPADTAKAVYRRMSSDRTAHAAKLRAIGEQEKLRIEAEADRERTVILAEAKRKSDVLRGEGEGQRNRILGDAYGKDPKFFEFYRSMEAYGAAFDKGTTMVLSPKSEFFRYFGSQEGKNAQ